MGDFSFQTEMSKLYQIMNKINASNNLFFITREEDIEKSIQYNEYDKIE
jgi:hypothetical protein